MSRCEFLELDVPFTSGGGAGRALDVSSFDDRKWIQVVGLSGGGTPRLEGTMDGNDWTTIVASVSNGFTQIAHIVQAIRLVSTATISAGKVHVGGLNVRAF